MFVQWEHLLDILTNYSLNNNFMEKFNNAANNEKVMLCMQDKFIRSSLEQWLDDVKFNDSLKNSAKSKETRLKGNEELKKDQFQLCYNLYTKAAQFAPYKSLEYALAFSNRSALHMKLKKFKECLKDIDVSCDVLRNSNISESEFNKGQLIVKLLKRKIVCFENLNQIKKGRACLTNLIILSNNVYNISLDVHDEFIKKYTILFNKPVYIGSDFVENDDITIEPLILDENLNENLIKKRLKNNNITLPYKSPKLKLCCTEAKGRHFVASSKIEYGELLIFENPFAFVLLPEYYNTFCYNCCVALKNYSIPCFNCCTILFCNEKCRQESWDSYHRWECKCGTSVFKCIGIAHLALRLMLETLCSDGKNDEIYKLLTHINDFKSIELLQYCLTATLLLIYLQKKTEFFQNHPKLNLSFVGNELLCHMTRLVCNGNAISTHIMSDCDLEAITSIINESQPRIGTAIFPTSSLLNHSCDPNIFSSNLLKNVVIKASRDIKEGEEILNCYGPNFRRMRLAERQSLLKAQYHFDCKCCICVDSQIDKFFQIIDGLVCLKCNNDIQATLSDLDINDTVYCSKCNEQFKTKEYKKHLIKVEKMFNKGMEKLSKNKIDKATDIISESLRLYTQVLNHRNSNVTKCEDNLAKCYGISGDFVSCYKYLEKSFKAIEERYGENSLEVAYELDKISDIIVYKLDLNKYKHLIKRALVYIQRSMKIFHDNLSAWNLPYNELNMANIKYKENILLQLMENKT